MYAVSQPQHWDVTWSLGTTASNGPTVPASDNKRVGNIAEMIMGKENRCTWMKLHLSATLSTTNTLWTTLNLNMCPSREASD